MPTITDLKQWTILNSRENRVMELTNEEFKAILDKGGVKLEGKEIVVNIHGQKIKVWVDASINN